MEDIPFFAVFMAMIGGSIAAMFAVAALVDGAIWLSRKFHNTERDS